MASDGLHGEGYVYLQGGTYYLQTTGLSSGDKYLTHKSTHMGPNNKD
jgi:hypothetical protein